MEQVNGTLSTNLRVWAVAAPTAWRLALINDTTERQRVSVTMPTSTPMTVKALSASSPWATSASFGGQTISGAGAWQGTTRTTTVTPANGTYTFTIPPDSAQIASPAS